MLSTVDEDLLREFKSRIMKAAPGKILGLRAFGSRARGEAKPESDLDVLVITADSDFHLSDQVVDVACQLLLDRGIYVSPKVISTEQYRDLEAMDSDFLYNVLRDGVAL